MPAVEGGRTAQRYFRPNDNVEVTSSEHGFVGVWFEAKALGQRRGSVKVRYKHLAHHVDHSSYLEESVNFHRVRPDRRKPSQPEELRPGDAVEAFLKDGWRAGHITASAGDGSLYVVSFPDSEPKNVHALNLRRRLDWVNGRWVAPHGTSVMGHEEAPNSLVATTKARESTFTLRKRQKPLESSGKSKENASSPIIDEKKKMKGNPQSRSGLSMHKLQSNYFGCSAAEVKEKIGSSYNKPSFDAEKGTPLPTGNNVVLKESNSMSSSESLVDLASLDSVPVVESPISSNKSPEVAVPPPSKAGSIPNLPNNKSDQLNPELLIHPVMKYSFVKKTSVWNALLSLDIFKTTQPPHFRLLQQVQENSREGIAIGLMVSFASMADNMCTLNVDDDTIDGLANRLDGLEDYEQHGFDVEVFRNRLKNLIQLKRTLDDYSREKAEIESAVAKIRKQRSKAASEAKELEGTVLILQKKGTEALDFMNKLGSEESLLLLKIQLITHKSHDLRNDFRM